MPKAKLEPKEGSSGATETTPLVNKNGAGGDGNEPGKSDGGLSTRQAALLVAGEMAGGGVLALPRALVRTGWVGVPILVVLCGVAAFNGKRLGDCWSLLEERDTQLRGRRRNPYAIIADQAFGKTMSVVVSIAMLVTLFGAGVVYLLLAAQLVESLLLTLVPTVTYCAWYLIVAGAMTPLMLFGTPKDFSFLGIITFGATVCACVLYFIEMIVDIRPFVFRWGVHGFQEFFLAIATFMFNFSGIASFPTIQNDMTDRSKFSKSLQYSFLAILVLYLGIGIMGYAVYGENAGPNFATSLSATPITLVANILMVVHLVTAFIVLINPVCQEMEQLYDVPRDSVGWRLLVRGSIMLAILFVGESIPRFYTILALVGGTSVALLTFVLPPACYLKLCSTASDSSTVDQPNWVRIVCWQIAAVAAVCGVLAGICSISIVFGTGLAVPCYLK